MSGEQGDERQAVVPYIGTSTPQDTRMENQSGSSDSDRNGNGPVVTFPVEDVAKIPACPGKRAPPQFFLHAPAFHWHIQANPVIDHAVRGVVEKIAHDAFAFGEIARERHAQVQTAIGAL